MTETTRTGSDLFVEALESYGVTHLFGNPGTTELPVMQALDDSDVKYVLSRRCTVFVHGPPPFHG